MSLWLCHVLRGPLGCVFADLAGRLVGDRLGLLVSLDLRSSLWGRCSSLPCQRRLSASQGVYALRPPYGASLGLMAVMPPWCQQSTGSLQLRGRGCSRGLIEAAAQRAPTSWDKPLTRPCGSAYGMVVSVVISPSSACCLPAAVPCRAPVHSVVSGENNLQRSSVFFPSAPGDLSVGTTSGTGTSAPGGQAPWSAQGSPPAPSVSCCPHLRARLVRGCLPVLCLASDVWGGGVKASDLRPPVLGGACPGPSCSAAVVKMALHVVLGVSARPRQPPGPAARPSNPCRASVSPSRGRSQAFHAASLSTLWPWPQRPPCPPLRQGSRLGAV